MPNKPPLPGQPGNPGRPKGATGKKLELFRSSEKKLQQKVIDMAMKGDVAALKIIADRLWPRLRTQASPLSIKADANDLAATGRKVIDKALAGEVTVDVLRELLGALYLQGQITELSEFERRLQELENRPGSAPPWESAKRVSERLPLRGRKSRRTKCDAN